MSDQEINAAIEKLAFKHQLAVEHLTESQLADAIRQAILCVDFQRRISTDNGQSVTYKPFRKLKDAERERDEAREAEQNWRITASNLRAECDMLREALNECERQFQKKVAENIALLSECDEAREKAERYRLEANAMMLQRDESREALREIAEASGFDNIGNWARNKAKSAIYR